ncbi:DUF4189 domain-containing protein [Rhodanobacter sp. BL-MT-08]
MKSLATLAVIGCLYAPLAWSQCSGVNAGGGCVPPPCTPGSPLPCNQQQQAPQQAAPQQPQAVWADRWGAIVLGVETVNVSTATGRASRSEAVEASMADCAAHGAKHCKLELAYYNQCAAMAWGSKNIGTAGAPTESLAQSNAMKYCGEASCKIVYTACSMAERVQ